MGKRHFSLKKSPSDEGDAIIVSFDGKWNEPMQSSSFSVVFRKHYPFAITPHWIYAYCGRPVSAIVAKMPVKSIQRLPLDDAVKLCDRSMHSEDEIRKYAKGTYRDYTELVVYEVGAIEYARKPVSFEVLANDYDFWPSSSFIPLSVEGRQTLDELAGFKTEKTGR